MNEKWFKRKKRISQIIEVGYDLDFLSRFYDIVNVLAIIFNLAVGVLYTFDNIRESYGALMTVIEAVTVGFFAVDYFLRVWTADILYS